MKYFYILLFLSLPVFAAHKYMVMQYNENVRIVLSMEQCQIGEGYKVAAQRIDRAVMRGCWKPNGNMVHIQWEGGDFSEFHTYEFHKVEIE